MELLPALAQTFDHTHRVIAGVAPDQRANPTPCREWDVEALMRHTVGVVANMGRAVSGQERLADVNGFPLDADCAGQFRTIADSTLDAWTAAGLDGETDIGAGPMPLPVALGINLLDTATHSWDLARATDQPDRLPAELAETILGIATGLINDDVRGFAGFDPAVTISDDASPADRLAAFLGRQP